MSEVLTSIWQRAFERPSIESDDNFFDLGGTPALARQIFFDIERDTGKFFVPEMIYQAPTIGAQEVLLEQPVHGGLNPLALLRARSGLPMFLAHGMGGNVFEFFELTKCIDWQGPIYALQARGNDGVREPFAKIEDLANYFLEAIRKVQPKGPYFLVGYSLGGLATLEMARRFSSLGEKVGLLVMIDSYPHRAHLRMLQYLAVTARGMMHRAWDQYAVSNRLANELPENTSIKLEIVSRRAYEAANRAWMDYRPSFYSGNIVFVKAAVPTIFPTNPRAVWGGLVREIEMRTAAGDHHEILTKNFQALGATLSNLIAETCMAAK